MNVKSYNTTDYENKSDWTIGQNKPNSNPISQRVKLMQSVYLQRNMKKNAAKDYEKTNPNKPNFKPDDGFSAHYTRYCHGAEFTLSAAEEALAVTFFGAFLQVAAGLRKTLTL